MNHRKWRKNKQKFLPGPRFNSGLFGLVKVGSFAPSRVDPLEIKKNNFVEYNILWKLQTI